MSDLTLYENARPDMKTGDTLLYKTEGIISWLVRRFTDFNHASLLYNIDGRIWTYEAEAEGVISNYLSEELADLKGEVWWYPLKDEFDDERRNLSEEYARMKKGTGYDFKGLFRNALGRVSANARKLFCSELVQLAYYYAKIILTIGKAARPGDLPNLGVYKTPIRIL